MNRRDEPRKAQSWGARCIVLLGLAGSIALPVRLMAQDAGLRMEQPAEAPKCVPVTDDALSREDSSLLEKLGLPPSVYPDGLPACASEVDLEPLGPEAEQPAKEDEPTFELPVETGVPPAGFETLTDLPIEGLKPVKKAGFEDAKRKKKDLPSEPRRVLQGWADLHTHMFADSAWPGVPGSGSTFIEGTVEGPLATAVARCTGATDHATIKPGYGWGGLGITSEGLTSVGGMLSFLAGGASHGDSGLHLSRRNGFDTRSCQFLCNGPLGCQFGRTETECLGIQSNQCKDDVPGNISLSAMAACNTRLSEASCDGSGYCGAMNSSLWSVADDLSPCWSHFPNCDDGDMCIKRDITKSLECNDLSQAECNNHAAECDWHSECAWDSGVLECSDLSQAECSNHASECNWRSECAHVSGSLTCGDLNQTECGNHSECNWSSFFNTCMWSSGSLTCGDLNATECGNHSECAWRSECYHPAFAPALSCGDLASNECGNHSECHWENECRHPIGAPALQCSDLTLAECGNHYADGGCGARDCVNVDCQWEEGCRWDPVWPANCGEHFRDWPLWDTPTHQQHWWGWVQDAYRSGLRVLSVSILEVHPLAKMFPAYSRLPHDVILDQIDAAHSFVANHPWAEIALSPAHARRIVESGRLALVLTIEAQFPFCTQEPCGAGPDEEDIANITTVLDDYYARGVRGMQLVGHFDNPYGGVSNYVAGIHGLQWLYEELTLDGQIDYSEFVAATPTSLPAIDLAVGAIVTAATGVPVPPPVMTSFPVAGFSDLNDIHALATVMGKVVGNECVVRGTSIPMNCAECLGGSSPTPCDSVRAVTPVGLQLVQALVDRHMLIDVAHLSDAGTRTVDAYLDSIPGGRTYPLYVSHGDPRDALKDPKTHLGNGGHKGPHQEKPTSKEMFDILRRRGGIFGVRTGPDEFVDAPSSGVPNDCAGSSKSFAQSLAYVVDLGMPVGFAVDMNGMIQNAAPRFRDHSKRSKRAACLGNKAQQALQTGPLADDPMTPFTNESEYNLKGLGHIGFLGAFVSELRSTGLATPYQAAIDNSAEQFVKFWERAQ